MAAKRKIVFIIVEGVSDQTALAAIISKIINTEQVIVEFANGDITSDYGVNTSNIVSKIGNFINDYRKTYFYKPSDFTEVIHIIDTDGAFINEEKVLHANTDEIVYNVDSMATSNVNETVKRNNHKVSNIQRLITLPSVLKTIPYSLYFFSCNLEHVLFDRLNVPQKEKHTLASEFAKKYRNNPNDFLSFIQNDTFAINKPYLESWEFISEDVNSLNRYTNINLLFSQDAKNIKRSHIFLR